MRRGLFCTAAIVCCALSVGVARATSEDASTNTIQVAGQLGLFAHKFEDGSNVEYCLLTPSDQAVDAFVIELDGALQECHQGLDGVFNVAPHTTAKRNKSGCDETYLPLCIESSFHLRSADAVPTVDVAVSASEEEESTNPRQKAAMNKITGARSILFLALNYQDATPACASSCISQNMWTNTYNIDGMYNEASYGLLRFSQSASKVVTLNIGAKVSAYDYCGSSGTSKIKADALAALASQQAGVSTSSYNHLVMMTPSLCGVAVSQIGGSLIWINSNIPDALAHELGHNLGRRHAALDTPNADPATLTSYTTAIEYGDKSCVMGYSGIGLRSHSVPNRIHMGWISSSAVVIPPASTCATSEIQYTVAASKLAANNAYGRHAVQFPRARGGTFFVSYRSGAGYDVNAPTGWKNAVFLHYSTSASSRTKFVKALQSGGSYVDSLTSMSLRVISMGTNSATVAVKCGINVGSCTMTFASNAKSSLAGTFYPVAKIGGYSAWSRADHKAVVGYCASKTLWVVGAHDGSSPANFNPCSTIIFKSAAQAYYQSPTDVETWYSCASSSCSQDTSATFTVKSCSASKHDEEVDSEGDNTTVAVSVGEDSRAAPMSNETSDVCTYFSSLCNKCQVSPTGICAYLTDLCADCVA